MAEVKQKISFNFEDELSRVLRRAERLRAAIKGSASVTTVQVKAHKVREHNVRAHARVIITMRK
jgi:hypothetical protein